MGGIFLCGGEKKRNAGKDSRSLKKSSLRIFFSFYVLIFFGGGNFSQFVLILRLCVGSSRDDKKAFPFIAFSPQ